MYHTCDFEQSVVHYPIQMRPAIVLYKLNIMVESNVKTCCKVQSLLADIVYTMALTTHC